MSVYLNNGLITRTLRFFSIYVVITFFLTSYAQSHLVAQTFDPIPQGSWEVTQITIEKNTDGKVRKTAHRTINDVQSYISFPQKWVVMDSETIVFKYADGTEETTKYKLEGNQLMINTAVAMQSYQISYNEEILTLRITHNYVNNLPRDRSEIIVEKWIVELKKQKLLES